MKYGLLIVLSLPLGVAINSVNGRVYVTNFESNTVSVIDGTTNISDQE